MKQHQWTTALLLFAGCAPDPQLTVDKCASAASLADAQSVPVAVPRLDHHQHLLNEGARNVTVDFLRAIGETSYSREAEREPLVDADQLVQMLDEAGIQKALVFSNAYYFARSTTEQLGEYEQVRAENDWTLAQVRRHPNRLYAACSVNPLRRYAPAEIERCAASGGFRALKLHFDGSSVDLKDPAHVASVRQAFATANRLRLPIVAHLQTEAGYGGRQARTFLSQILPEAPGVPVTVNHLWGGGGYGRGPADVLAIFAEAFQRRDPGVGNLWFDLAQVSMAGPRDRDRAQLVERMRQIGFTRLLYGSDGPEWSGVPPKQHWEEFSACMPLTRDELNAIAANIAPYLR
jgi:predicted TIM-barrel fold metal-dependent hydrolase